MSNIAVRKEGSRMPQQQRESQEWEPGRMIRQFFGWDPFREMMPVLRNDPASFMPAFDVKETKDGYLFKADLPGVKEDDLDITITGNRLAINGKREAEKQEKTDTYYAYERSSGSFTRTFTLPDDCDRENVHAEMRDGVLTLHVGRKAEAQQTKQIPLRSNAPKA